jgi:hypothetical protein
LINCFKSGNTYLELFIVQVLSSTSASLDTDKILNYSRTLSLPGDGDFTISPILSDQQSLEIRTGMPPKNMFRVKKGAQGVSADITEGTSPRGYVDIEVPESLKSTLDALKVLADTKYREVLEAEMREHLQAQQKAAKAKERSEQRKRRRESDEHLYLQNKKNLDVQIQVHALDMKPGYLPQGLHYDYKSIALDGYIHTGPMPYNFIIALQPNTHLWVKKGNHLLKIHVPVGHIMILAGDLIHAGGCYDEYNIRLHGYIDTPKFRDGSRSNQYVNSSLQPFLHELSGSHAWTAKRFKDVVAASKYKTVFNWLVPYEKVVERLQAREDIMVAKVPDLIKEQMLKTIDSEIMHLGQKNWADKKFEKHRTQS